MYEEEKVTQDTETFEAERHVKFSHPDLPGVSYHAVVDSDDIAESPLTASDMAFEIEDWSCRGENALVHHILRELEAAPNYSEELEDKYLNNEDASFYIGPAADDVVWENLAAFCKEAGFPLFFATYSNDGYQLAEEYPGRRNDLKIVYPRNLEAIKDYDYAKSLAADELANYSTWAMGNVVYFRAWKEDHGAVKPIAEVYGFYDYDLCLSEGCETARHALMEELKEHRREEEIASASSGAHAIHFYLYATAGGDCLETSSQWKGVTEVWRRLDKMKKAMAAYGEPHPMFSADVQVLGIPFQKHTLLSVEQAIEVAKELASLNWKDRPSRYEELMKVLL